MRNIIEKVGGNRLILVLLTIAIASLLLASCGGGGGGSTPVTYSISGQVTSGGSGLAGVTMTLSGAGSATATTDSSGNYTFSGLVNGNYTVTPSKTDFTFNPSSSAQTVADTNITALTFTATPNSVPTFSISGTVTSGGSALSGVTMTLSGAGSATATTNASGSYTFSGLSNGGYTVTPTMTGFTFSPASSLQTVSGANITAVNFVATAVPALFSISGTVTSGGSGLSGVTMTLSGAASATATTNASGAYTFSGLANGSYAVTPTMTGFTFSPASSPQTLSGANITAVNFTATPTQSAQIVACPSSGTTNVTIQDFSFTSSAVTISVNGIVKWTNNGPSTHTVTSGVTPTNDGKFNSGNLGTGSTVCVQFLAAGSYPYFCTPHPFMTGSVTVQ